MINPYQARVTEKGMHHPAAASHAPQTCDLTSSHIPHNIHSPLTTLSFKLPRLYFHNHISASPQTKASLLTKAKHPTRPSIIPDQASSPSEAPRFSASPLSYQAPQTATTSIAPLHSGNEGISRPSNISRESTATSKTGK